MDSGTPRFAQPSRVELEILRGRARSRCRPVNVPAFLIGRSRDCDLVLGDKGFPEVYAYLIVHAGGISIRHLDFGPELMVNGESVSRTALYDGDRLEMGPYEFLLHIGDSTSEASKPTFLSQLPLHSHASCVAAGTDIDEVTGLLTDVRLALGKSAEEVRRSA